jgi:hypothetical protein
MSAPPALKPTLKRGALVAAANWPLVAVQFIADGTLKLLLGVPVVGGVFLVVLLLGADTEDVLSGEPRQVVGAVVSALGQNPAALAAFALAFIIVLLGGSALTFIVKGGTVSLLAAAESLAGPIERPPLRLGPIRRANVTDIEPFLDGCQRFWQRYLKLGACLLIVYAATAAAYLTFMVGGYSIVANAGELLGWTIAAALASSALIVWITLVNFFYLLTQMVIAVEDVGLRAAFTRVARFVRARLREVAGIFGIVLLLVVLATIASILAAAGLGLIAFVPFVGLAVMPLQVTAWLLRGFVFQYLALAALGAYLTQYRQYVRPAPPESETSAVQARRERADRSTRAGSSDPRSRDARDRVRVGPQEHG